MYGYGYGYYIDPTYILVLLGMVLCLLASGYVNSVMGRYKGVRNKRGYTGAELARAILNREGLTDVEIEMCSGSQGDHYDPRRRAVVLSRTNYERASITAMSVAAHECGHAIQHARGYAPLQLRSAFVPIANIGSSLGMPLIFIGLLFSFLEPLIQVGILAFSMAVIFQIITLPVEFNASRRALAILSDYDIAEASEIKGCRKVLRAAALTYVAAAASSLLQLLRLVLLFGGNRRDND